ncbi:MAG: tyrosine protein kinase, partial [Parabacteroides sp.]|nr:tyrosine protein kinase [Parabacteroides sp.]
MERDNEVISLKNIIIYYLNHWKLFLTSGIISLVIAILYLILYPKTYEVMSVVKIQDEKDLSSGGGIS